MKRRTRKCPACQHTIPRYSTQCPYCGWRSKIANVGYLLVAVLIAGAIMLLLRAR
ncbi:MAG TPA: hypothetical protein VFB38_10055 [Chthonomonadaceae bacterium]|nr:hypothetical protein [Chthonomonadaceae bacterium]